MSVGYIIKYIKAKIDGFESDDLIELYVIVRDEIHRRNLDSEGNG